MTKTSNKKTHRHFTALETMQPSFDDHWGYLVPEGPSLRSMGPSLHLEGLDTEFMWSTNLYHQVTMEVGMMVDDGS